MSNYIWTLEKHIGIENQSYMPLRKKKITMFAILGIALNFGEQAFIFHFN